MKALLRLYYYIEEEDEMAMTAGDQVIVVEP
jgi:hypothetical protein